MSSNAKSEGVPASSALPSTDGLCGTVTTERRPTSADF